MSKLVRFQKNGHNNNNKFVERHFPMVQWRFTAITKKKEKKNSNLNMVKQVSNLHKNKEKGVI